MATIQYLTTIEFGAGVVQQPPQVLTSLGIRRPMLVTGPGPGARRRAGQDRGPAGAGILAGGLADTPANTTEAAVMQAAGLFRDGSCDGVVGIGGGSPLDLAKGSR
ncbi:MAG: iron-containing alcohol dehydrogenase [Burkholderiaceae bacterium]